MPYKVSLTSNTDYSTATGNPQREREREVYMYTCTLTHYLSVSSLLDHVFIIKYVINNNCPLINCKWLYQQHLTYSETPHWGHPCNQDTYICPKGVWNRGVPMYNDLLHLFYFIVRSRSLLSLDTSQQPIKWMNWIEFYKSILPGGENVNTLIDSTHNDNLGEPNNYVTSFRFHSNVSSSNNQTILILSKA